MTFHRIDHAVVIDTDDIPGRGGYAVVGISPYVTPAERAFLGGNFGISDYLHDPQTENRIYYSVFRIPGANRYAFVRRFARSSELRRNNTQRRLVVHTLLLDQDVWNELYALPWLLLNAKLELEGTREPFRLSRDVPWQDENAAMPALLWSSDDAVVANVAAKLRSRIDVVAEAVGGADAAGEMLARVLTVLASRASVVLPQEATQELVTMLAWSMLPRRDRDELAWTHHDARNLSGVSFPLANAPGGALDASTPVATFAAELVRMNTESEESWLDVQERTARHPLTVRHPKDLDKWMVWRDAFLQLRQHIGASETAVTDFMKRLADAVKQNPGAPWIDAEETLDLIWGNVSDAIRSGMAPEVAITTWSQRLKASGLAAVIFRAAPSTRWLVRAAAEVKNADVLVGFFLAGTGEGKEAKPTRAALAEWLVTHHETIDQPRLVQLVYLLAGDRSPWLHALLEVLLKNATGLGALVAYLTRRTAGGAHLVHEAAPIVLARNHAKTEAFFRDVFVRRCDPDRVDSKLARDVAAVLRTEPAAFREFLRRLSPGVRVDLIALLRQWIEREPEVAIPLARVVLADLLQEQGGLASAGPLAIALAYAGEPARTWLEVLLRIGRSADPRADAEATREFVAMLDRIDRSRLDLSGAMERLVPVLENDEIKSAETIRALLLLARGAWESGGNQFVRQVRRHIDRAPLASAWRAIVLAYASDLRTRRPVEVSELAAAFWCRVDPADMPSMDAPAIALLDVVDAAGVQRLQATWRTRFRSLPICAAAERLLSLLRQERSWRQEVDLAVREIRNGVATADTLVRLEAALARVNEPSAARTFAHEVELYLEAGGPAMRLARLLDLFARDITPTVRLVLQTHVLGTTLHAMKTKRYWKELRAATRTEDLLAPGAVVRLAYAAGAHADRKTRQMFEQTWRANGCSEALDALAAGRHARRPVQWMARVIGLEDPSPLAQ